MDTSETYIKMCEKAEKIQKSYLPKERNLRAVFKPRERLLSDGTSDITAGTWDVDEYPPGFGIWLPRQDELQEIAGGYTEDKDGFVQLLHDFEQFIEFLGVPSFYHSMEQLWLAFVMKEKYQKVWDGNNWIE